MNRLYQWIDWLWQLVAERVFVRFEYDVPLETLRKVPSNKIVFATPEMGLIDWLILTSWCRKVGLDAVKIANRKRILALGKPGYFLKLLFRRASYADFFLSPESGPRLLLCPLNDRKKPFTPTPSEKLLSEVFNIEGNPEFVFVPLVFFWRKHARGGNRTLSEYFFGLRSRPNFIGKIWYLIRRGHDSMVKGMEPFGVQGPDEGENATTSDDNEAMRLAKFIRRRILVSCNQEVRIVLGPLYQSPHSVKETLIKDPDIQKLVNKTAAEEGLDRRKVMARAYKDLSEIVATYRFRFVEVLYVFLNWLFNRIFEGIDVEEKELQVVRELMKTKPVVFVPCHRSHFDYLVIPYLLFDRNMVTPHIAAGVNLAFWPVGYLLRMGGAFFIRRSFRGDPLYSLSVKKYIEYLLANRYNIKFFIEGTRSRTGKMLAPAYGILKMLLEAQQKKVCEDIAFVPVSICYDEVPEQGSYGRELTGGSKVKESATELIKSRKVASKNVGKVYVRFAPEIMASEVWTESGTEGIDATLTLQKTAFRISKRINDVTPVTPKSLVASVLLSHRISALSLGELIRVCLMLAEYVEVSGYSLSVNRGEGLRGAVEQTVKKLQKSGLLSVTGDVPRSYYCDNKKRILLNFYKNNGAHCLVMPSITILSVFKVMSSQEDKASVSVDTVLEKAKSLRGLLKFEFFFSPTRDYIKEIEENLSFFFGSIQGVVGDRHLSTRDLKRQFENWDDVSVYLRLLGDLFESYRLVLQYLKENPKPCEKKALIQKVLKYAENLKSKGKVTFLESASVQSFSNAISLFDNMRLVDLQKSNDKTIVAVKPWGDVHENIRAMLTRYLDLMETDPEILAGEMGTITNINLTNEYPEPV